MDTRSSTPEAPPQDLWSSILDSVSKSRSIPSKQILLLGQPSSGKSTLTAALLQKPAPDSGKDALKTDFALGYDYNNVRDEADEDTLARLSVYTVPSSNPSYTALLPTFLPPRTCLPHSLAMIVLDWTRPWTFVEELETWFQWIETWVNSDTSREATIAREESRERLQSHLQHYTEPSAEPIPATSSLSSNTLLPLGSGVLTHNSAGIPIIVVCTKADLIDEQDAIGGGVSGMGGMVKGKAGETEERTDGIMQVLRTICLKYGAALFYTTPLPNTLLTLRQYALHLLFAPPAPQPGMASASTTEASAPTRNPFVFNHRPNTLDRDRLVIPAGWDSWGKITVVREFEPRAWGDAWERDTDEEGEDGAAGAKKLYASLVPDQGAKPHPLPPFNNPTPEQAFLAKNYDENSKKPHRDPMGLFRNAGENPEANGTAGVVGPLGSHSLSLPTVERMLSEMEVGISPNSSSGSGERGARRLADRHTNRPPPVGTGSGQSTGRTPTSPLSTSPNATGGQSQHEVLQNFFQSLLTKDRGSSRAAPPARVNGSGNTAAAGEEES